MKIFLDTADLEEIQKWHDRGVICGVTTNPIIMKKAGVTGPKYAEHAAKIHQIIGAEASVSVEAVSLDAEELVAESIDLVNEIHQAYVDLTGSSATPAMMGTTIKIPMIDSGLIAATKLVGVGIKVNVTIVFSVEQAILACATGCQYLSPFMGRSEDVAGSDGNALLGGIVHYIDRHGLETEIIAASVRHPTHAVTAGMAGSHIATILPETLELMLEHHMTESVLNDFLEAYEA